jgi:plastocyanin
MRRTFLPPIARTLATGPCKKAAVVALTATVTVGFMAGCGADDESAADAAPSTAPGVGVVTTAADGVQEITIQTQDDYTFVPDTFTVAPGRVRLTLFNAAQEMTHNLEFDEGEGPEPIDAGIDFLAPQDEETIEFEVTEPGDHPFTCTFHVQLGQTGTMTVSG